MRALKRSLVRAVKRMDRAANIQGKKLLFCFMAKVYARVPSKMLQRDP